VVDLKIVDMGGKILCDKSTMTAIGLFLTTKKTIRIAQLLDSPNVFDPTLVHQLEKCVLVFVPPASTFLVRAQELWRGGEKWDVRVLDGANFFEKVWKILLLGEAGKL